MSKISEENAHFYWLDLLRFLAALIVVLGHFRGAFFVEYSLLPVNQQNPIVFVLRLFEYYGFPKSANINLKSMSLYIIEIFIAIVVAYAIYWLFEKRTDVVKKRIRSLMLN